MLDGGMTYIAAEIVHSILCVPMTTVSMIIDKQALFQTPSTEDFKLDLQLIGSSPDLQRLLIRARQMH